MLLDREADLLVASPLVPDLLDSAHLASFLVHHIPAPCHDAHAGPCLEDAAEAFPVESEVVVPEIRGGRVAVELPWSREDHHSNGPGIQDVPAIHGEMAAVREIRDGSEVAPGIRDEKSVVLWIRDAKASIPHLEIQVVEFLGLREDSDHQDPCFVYFELDAGEDIGSAAGAEEDINQDDLPCGIDFLANIVAHFRSQTYVSDF